MPFTFGGFLQMLHLIVTANTLILVRAVAAAAATVF